MILYGPLQVTEKKIKTQKNTHMHKQSERKPKQAPRDRQAKSEQLEHSAEAADSVRYSDSEVREHNMAAELREPPRAEVREHNMIAELREPPRDRLEADRVTPCV